MTVSLFDFRKKYYIPDSLIGAVMWRNPVLPWDSLVVAKLYCSNLISG